MDEDTPEPKPERPRFLLPDGCKDLVDALRLQQQRAEAEGSPDPCVSASTHDTPQTLPASVTLHEPVNVRDLASALHLTPFQVVGALMQFNVFATLDTALDFETAAALCSHYGVAPTKAD